MLCSEEGGCSSRGVFVAATIEASHLTDQEREIILGVLTKDEQLRRQQQLKIMQLKSELQNLRRKGAIKVSTDWDSTGPDPDRSCGRCRVELGRVINRGAYCRVCRLKVCKSCREYNFRSTDWVCTVCHKRMEIQAASGEWMNEFVRRPSRRRDTRVYVPAADIIKRTIRRSWTISNPTPRWAALRGSPELRPYNSLPRGQDINNFPALAMHRENLRNSNPVRETGRSPNRRTQSEDVYQERNQDSLPCNQLSGENTSGDVHQDTASNHDVTRKSIRVNPLLLLAENKENRERKTSPKRKKGALENVHTDAEVKTVDKEQTPSRHEDHKPEERHVSFDCGRTSSDFIARSRSLSQSKPTADRTLFPISRSLTEEGADAATGSEVSANASLAREEQERAPAGNPAELPCDIEPVSGTVFRKMTVRQRRQENMRKMQAVDAGWRRAPETDLLDFLLPDGEDYRLVFVSSDGSSKEEEVDDNDSSSASSFPIDECYWDYFEPGANKPQMFGWGSPFGSPRVYRKGLADSPIGSPLADRRRKRTIRESSDEDTSAPSPSDGLFGTGESSAEVLQCMHQNQQRHTSTTTAANQTECHFPCQTCGGSSAAQFIPIPVPVPIPFPVPWGSVSAGDSSNPMVLYKQLHQKQNLWQYFAEQASSLVWPAAPAQKPMIGGEENGGEGSKESGKEEEEDEDGEPVGHLESENRASSGPDSTSSDSSDSDPENPRVSRVYNVSGSPNSRDSDDALPSSNVTSDCDEGNEPRCSDDEHEDEETSSGSADTDSNDTGTVADQKPKRFSRVFVVNHKGSSSSSSEAVTSSNEDTDSSDNDTDTEMDCTVVLTNIKPLGAEEMDEVEKDGDQEPVGSGLKLIGLKYFDEYGEAIEAGPSRDKEPEKVRKVKQGRRHGPTRTTKMEKDETKHDAKRNSGLVAREIAGAAEDRSSEVEVKDCDSRGGVDGGRDKESSSNEETHKEDYTHNDGEDTNETTEVDDEAEDRDDDCQEFEDSLNAIPTDTGNAESGDKGSNASAIFGDVKGAAHSANWKSADVSVKPFRVPSGNEQNESNFRSATLNAVDRAANVKNTDYSSSPCLSDVSAESLSSSDAEKDTGSPGPERGGPRRAVVGGAGVLVSREASSTADLVHRAINNAGARYTSLVMITGDDKDVSYRQQVNVVTSHTTKVVSRGGDGDRVVVVRHTNRDDKEEEVGLAKVDKEDNPTSHHQHQQSVTVITGADTLSAFEEGLADDDSWVENLSNNDEDDDDFATNSASDNSSSGDEVTLICSAVVDQEDELRGYHRTAIDFTLHTIVEESCEESEVEQSAPKKKERPPSATDLEKYFFFGLGDGTIPSSINSNREDAFSETSSIYSEGMESSGGQEEPTTPNDNSAEELASSRLEKYFLSGFMGFAGGRRDSDGSVGSDSEGKPSPEQRRKRLVRARGTGRSHSSSLDNLLANPDLAANEQQPEVQNSEDSSSSDTDTYDEIISFEKTDGQFDTVKRKKGKKQKVPDESKEQEMNDIRESDEDEDGHKTPQPEILPLPTNLTTSRNQQSRDSGFVGSCDDLLRDQKDAQVADTIPNPDKIATEKREDRTTTQSIPPNTLLTRRDSFNNWSSDEETNLMMCKMRQFFKTMVANGASSKPTTPNLSNRTSPKPLPRTKSRCKPPQLVYFENELTRLMKTVPGIRDDQVREIVEYLSSEDTWSDSYDSSDYTSSDLEGASTKSALQQQISDSCKQIINKFDAANAEDEEGDAGDGGIQDDSHGLNKETAFVYQKLVASFEKMAAGDKPVMASGPNSPPLIAKVMHHIGSRLVALMHEVSSGESHASNSPRSKNYHRRLQQKLSNASSTTTDDDSTSDSNLPDTFLEEPYGMLPRSRSHDLLMSDAAKNMHQSTGGSSDIVEEREVSDCERFSWRGSFESALLATDSRNKLSLIGGEGSASASALAIAAKRRSAGDLLFSHKSLSREQLDRVRSCGSIGGASSEDKLWATRPNRRRSSVPDAASCGSGGSADGEDEDDDMDNRATLPRSLQSGPQTTNSLPRLPTSAVPKAQSQYAKSARYRPPGFSRLLTTTVPKRAVSAPGLQLTPQRRGRRSQQSNVPSDDVSLLSEAHSSPMLATRGSKSATPSPVATSARRKTSSISSQEWPTHEDDIDRLVALHHNRSSLSSLGLRSDSMASVYSGAGEGRYGAVTVRGQVEFGLQYNYKAGALEIQIKQCKDLAPVDIKRNRSDPYVKVYLLPDKSKGGKRKTKVKKHTLNPVFDECLKFHMSLNELEIRTLWLTVWHSDMFGRNDFLGEVMMTLENKVFDEPTPKWYNLQERTEPFDDMLSFKGDVIVCLKFVPPDMTAPKKGKRSRGALHVLIKEAKGLTAIKANGTSDPFCKSYLLPDKGRSSKQKTPVAKRTINPVWNHTFVYDDVTLQELAERCLELTVWDHDRLASNEFLGGVRFSLGTGKHYGKSVEWMDATGKELSLWKSMLERPNFWVEGCLALRPSLETRAS